MMVWIIINWDLAVNIYLTPLDIDTLNRIIDFCIVISGMEESV